jgi:lipoic acid synthetase
MLMGDICTRGCKFCAVKTGNPMQKLDAEEPKKLARALAEIKLFDYVVLTSVNRDDLSDGGASHFAECIKEIKKEYPEIIVEVLIPDFNGNIESLKKIIEAKPEVIAHNIETVERLQRKARDARASYTQSLGVLENVKKLNPRIYTKSSIMLGLGEADDEVIQAMKDLRVINADILTIGQYLRPTDRHLPISSFVEPSKFRYFEQKALEMGFLFCASGPFVRSSYKAGELFLKNVLKSNGLKC